MASDIDTTQPPSGSSLVSQPIRHNFQIAAEEITELQDRIMTLEGTTGAGTVTSVAAGIGLIGGTITTTGALSLDTPVSLLHGGTGATTVAAARANLDLTDVVTSITAGTGLTGGTITGGNAVGTIALASPVAIANGGTGAITVAAARANLGLSESDLLTSITAGTGLTGGTITTTGTIALASPVAIANGGTGATTEAAARVNLGLTDFLTSVTAGAGLTGGTITTTGTIALASPVAIANGGTGATTEAAARTNLGLTDVVSSITAGTGLTGGTITTTGTIALASPVAIANGGTGATTEAAAIANLGVLPLTGGTLANSSTGSILQINTASGSAQTGLLIEHTSTGTGLRLNTTAAGEGIYLNGQGSVSTRVLGIWQAPSTALLSMFGDGSMTTGNILVNNLGNAVGIDINSTGTGNPLRIRGGATNRLLVTSSGQLETGSIHSLANMLTVAAPTLMLFGEGATGQVNIQATTIGINGPVTLSAAAVTSFRSQLGI